MITALVFTIVLNGAEARFGYDYPNEMACNSAICQCNSRMTSATRSFPSVSDN